MQKLNLNKEQRAMLAGEKGEAKQMAMRLIVDLAAAAGAEELAAIQGAHISGVSPLTGGMGLLQFLRRLTQDKSAKVAVATTLNAAGCDFEQFQAMHIAVPGFLEDSQEIVSLYKSLGISPIQSCVPYEWNEVLCEGVASWAESNAICYGNSYTGLITNRDSGLSALASALTGYTPKYGLLEENNRQPNLNVLVSTPLKDPTDYSILGDWIGKQLQVNWEMPYGPIPLISGLPWDLGHDQRKALSAAAANYGSPMLYIEEVEEVDNGRDDLPAIEFTADDLLLRYEELRPRQSVSLIVIGCPQASISELRAAAELLRGRKVAAEPGGSQGQPPIWIFTSAANKGIAERTGISKIFEESGALFLENTCPEVVPYDQSWVKHVLTNSMKAEHYISSGLNGIPTSVMRLSDCIAMAAGDIQVKDAPIQVAQPVSDDKTVIGEDHEAASALSKTSDVIYSTDREYSAAGFGLPSQGDFTIQGQAFVTDQPITFLGFVNRKTGVIEEQGHPANGQSMAGKIAIFPKGSGSTVAPYVLLELYYRTKAPLAIINTEIDQQSAPACSLEEIPYAYGFDAELFNKIRNGDFVELRREGESVTIKVLS